MGIRGRTVAILGLGRIGMEIAKLAEMFDARVLYTARGPKDVPYDFVADLTEMARQADVLFVICPLTEDTRHIVTREVMDALGPDGILVNIARGPVVDEAALVAAIADGTLGHAALDVFEAEPKVPEGLKARANVTLAPHIGSATVETRRAMSDLVCRNLESFATAGTVLTPVPECRHLATLSDEPV
jgi:lactate dehydrogenase-like 2-hydroxyacid dehydrogenase